MKTPMKFVTAGFVMLSTVVFGAVGAQAGFVINLQPIIFCDDDGTGCADTQATGFTQYFETASDTIWAQGKLDFNFLSSVQIDNTALNTGVDAESAADVQAILAAGAAVNFNAMILNIMFVENTFLGSPVNFLFGFACDQCAGSTNIGIVINDVIFGNEALGTRLDTIAHEVGHILGLGHNDFGAGGAANLMTSGSFRTPAPTIADIAPNGANLDQLTAAQLTQALSDDRYVKVPEPGSLALFVTGLLIIFLLFGRARSARAVA